MANSTVTLMTSLTMIALFTIAIIGFTIGFANDNDAEIRLDNNTRMSSLYSSTRGGISNQKADTEEAYSSIINTTIESGSDIIKSPFVIINSWGNIYRTFGTIINVVNEELFGDDPAFGLFFTILITTLGILFTLYVLKAWRGNP